MPACLIYPERVVFDLGTLVCRSATSDKHISVRVFKLIFGAEDFFSALERVRYGFQNWRKALFGKQPCFPFFFFP